MRVAFVHDWLDTYRGGEKTLEALLPLYPDAPIHTLFYDSSAQPESIRKRSVMPVCSCGQRWRKLLYPYLPRLIESIDTAPYDLLISSSSGFAKGVIPRPDAKHLCYLHSPMRYAWDQRFAYEREWPTWSPARWIFNNIGFHMRQWDVSTNPRVDRFVVNSTFVAERVRRYYGRESHVVHPPIDVQHLQTKRNNSGTPSRDFWLVAGAVVPYKRVDIAIKACELLKQKLIVVGQGATQKTLHKLAGPHTTLMEQANQSDWETLLFNARGLIYPGVEDFGMVPIEAMALGTPVVAFNGGGARDYIKHQVNGLFFNEQQPESLSEALQKFNSQSFDSAALSKSTDKFATTRFVDEMRQHIDAVLKG